jgi:FAD/FMN-containing dehydrogenase
MKPLIPSSKEGIPKSAQKELTDLLGEKNVCFTRDMLSVYRCGPGAPFPGSKNPDGMVQPETVEEIQAIMRIANKYKFPVIVVGTAGPGVCLSGGLIIDTYARMRKIHKIDPESGYALVEPGVTNGQLLKALRPLGYWISFGSYPPYVGEIASLVCFNGYTNIIGKEHHFCIGLEVVLPTGDIIRTGTAALGYDWWTQYRGVPDLTSMWAPSFGTHGIITKAALRIHPLGEERKIVIAGFHDFNNALELINNLSKEAMANTSMIWSHRWTEWENYQYQDGKGFMDYVNHMLTLGPDNL